MDIFNKVIETGPPVKNKYSFHYGKLRDKNTISSKEQIESRSSYFQPNSLSQIKHSLEETFIGRDNSNLLKKDILELQNQVIHLQEKVSLQDTHIKILQQLSINIEKELIIQEINTSFLEKRVDQQRQDNQNITISKSQGELLLKNLEKI